MKKHLHAHHIQHWAQGGPTEIGNPVQLCSHHHQLVHEGGYRVERGAGAPTWSRRSGRPAHSHWCGSAPHLVLRSPRSIRIARACVSDPIRADRYQPATRWITTLPWRA